MPDYTVNWFGVYKQRLFKRYLQKFLTVDHRVSILEVGSYEGRSTLWMAKFFEGRDYHIECVDPFTNDGVKQRFMANTATLRDTQHVSITTQYSTKRLPVLASHDTKYDFIYLDGSHEGCNVYFDAALAFRLLKVDGVLCFDDYTWNSSYARVRPKKVIDGFLVAHAPMITVLHKDKQVWLRKTLDVDEFMRFYE